MSCSRKVCLALLLATSVTLLFSASAVAEDGPQDASVETQPGAVPAPQKAAIDADDGWHVGITPYLWFAGVHGTVGALGHDTGIHASFGDIFKYFNIGLMGVVEPRYKRFSMPIDFMWMKLSDDKGLAFDQGPTSVKIKVTETLLTPKVAYRIVNGEKIKVDGNFGIRYWHLGEDLSFQPPGILRNVSQSVNWVDVIAGAKIEAALSPKVLVTVLGDAGGGGANSDYQVAGFLGYRLKPNVTLQGGWRYLDVNYRPGGPRFLYNTATSGLMLGVTFNVK